MSDEFEHDLKRGRAALDEARNELLDVVSTLSDADMDAAPRGQWPVRLVLRHVVWHEQIYVRYIAHLRGGRIEGEMPDYTPSVVNDARRLLSESRAALLSGIDGVDEETFYRLGNLGFEEYSIMSMLENEANHEREHAEQIRKTLAVR